MSQHPEMQVKIYETPKAVVNVRQFLRLQAAIMLMAAMFHLAILSQDQGEVANMVRSNYAMMLIALLLAIGLEALALGIEHKKDWARIITVASCPIVMGISFFWVLKGIIGLIWIIVYAVVVAQLFRDTKGWFFAEEPVSFEKHIFHFMVLGIIIVLGFAFGTYVVNHPDLLINSCTMSG